jgi:phosphoribosylanthranilate isomerase
MRDEANINAVLEALNHADNEVIKPAMLGFIFYEHSPRFVGDALEPDFMRTLQQQVKTIGVFVNASEQTILQTVERYHLCGVQLHGKETPVFAATLKEKLPKDSLLLKAFSIAEKQDFMSVTEFQGMIDYALFDTKGAQHGGNGTRFDWTLLDEFHAPVPFLLSGGIALEHAKELASLRHPFLRGVDVNSRFETAPALKSASMLAEFVTQLASATNFGYKQTN